MAKTTLFFFFFWFGLLISLILLPAYYFLKIFGFRNAENKYVHYVSSRWARFTLFTAGVKLSLSGMENIPAKKSGLVVISNHQGNFDIPVIIACLPFAAGFIAKKEMAKFPFISNWMRALDCLFINRNRAREAGNMIFERLRQTDKNPIFLFPEGTRSKGPQMGAFKTGSLKLIFQNQMDILPITISGSYKSYEQVNNVKSGNVKVTFHPVMHTIEFAEFESFNIDLQRIIADPLKRDN
jgi:1-acyl-sn-glycerol-3-phosphate acyltransferase